MHNEDAYIPYLKTHEEALENSNLAEFKDLDYKNDIIYFALDLPNNDQFINNVRTFTEQLKKAHFPSKLCLRINVSDTYLTKDQIEALIELDAILQSKQCTPLHIIDSGNKMFESTFEIGNEYKNGYSLSVITKLNNTIDQLVTNIQERQLSPTEAMVYIHHYVSSMFIYRESHNLTFYFEGNKASAFIPGINKQYLVCCGFTDLVKTIVDRCNDLHIWDNQQECSLSCQEVNTIIYENKDGSDIESIMKGESSSLEYGGHSSTMLTITDPKYGLLDYKGYSDSMWEENSNKMVPTFQHFLLPANTIYFHKNRDIKLTGKKIFSKNFIDTENTSSISDQVSDTTLDRKTLEKALFTTFAKVFPLRSFNDMKDYFTSVIDWSVNSNNPWEDEIRIFKGQSTPLLSEDEMFELYITAIKELPNSSILNEQSKIIDKANNLQNPNFSQFRKYDESLYDRSKRNNSIWGANSKELLDAIKHLDNTTDNRSI